VSRHDGRTPAPAEKAADATSAEDDLDVLHPQRSIDVGGRELVIREYGLVEGLRLRPLHGPLVAALADASRRGEADDYEMVLDVLARHADALVALMAAAADTDEAFVRSLRGADADLLVLTWWSVNRDFFSLAVVRRLSVRALAPAGPTSTSASPDPASAVETSSASGS
jgi:hypothetical protein